MFITIFRFLHLTPPTCISWFQQRVSKAHATLSLLLGAISTMPAVRTFSLYAGVAVFFNFILQVHNNLIYTHTHRVLSVILYSQRFLLLMYLDALRTKNNYLEILCCIQIPKNSIPFRVRLNLLNWIMRKFISRFVLHKFVRPVAVS